MSHGTLRLTTRLVAVGSALMLAACGSGRSASTTGESQNAALTYVNCLRGHGVSNFPDPSPDGRLPNIPSDIDTTAPVFRSAQIACAKLEPGVTAGSSKSGSRLASLLAAAHCMRGHGLANFPDPSATPPPPPPPGARTGNAVGGPGGYLVLPPTSPAVAQAEAACGLRMR